MSCGQLAAAVAASVALLAASPARADGQAPKSSELVQTLTELMDAAKLDSLAARLGDSPDEFVAALYFPGAQLLVISAKYAVPALMNEKILLHRYRDVYIDLHSATEPATRVLVEDIRANGLYPARTAENDAFDIYSRGRDSVRVAFDGEWRKQKLSEEEYKKLYREAEAQYVRMLESLIAELKKGKTTQ